MTVPLFLEDSYQKSATAQVIEITADGGIICDRSIFYATSGGQPGDRGELVWDGGTCKIATTIKGENGAIVLVAEEGASIPPIGTMVTQNIDWENRYALMRMHTALHLLSVVIPLPVTGGSIGADKGRLDFDMVDAPSDKDALNTALNELILNDFEISYSWITDAELDANPTLVKTMSVQPPRGSGRVRLVRIGTASEQIDLQPCGGTHVARTGEIGRVEIGKIEKKGRQNRRVSINFVD